MKMTKLLLTLLAIAILGVSFAACGGPSTSTGSATTSSVPKRDRDDDGDNNDDDAHVLYYGRTPTATERQVLTALVTGYYAAAAAEDGARACALLIPFVAESVVEQYGHTTALKGKTCAAVMSKLFKAHHKLISGESASLKFYTVRVRGVKALTVLSFANLPEIRQLAERRAGSAWKVLDLLDTIVE